MPLALFHRRFARLALIGLAPFVTGCQIMNPPPLGLEGQELIAPPYQEAAQAGAVRLVNGQPGSPHLATQPGKEMSMVSLPEYRIEPPDILLISVIRLAPKSPYYVSPLDILQVVALGTPENAPPLAGQFQVDPSGVINLGPSYGSVRVADQSIPEITDSISKRIRAIAANAEVSVSLIQAAGLQQIVGEHLVGPDGTVNLGAYGSVYIANMTLEEAKAAIERQLERFLEDPEVSIDVFAYNSKVFYIITEGAGFGDNVVRVPVTGNETVLDAIAQVGGMSQISNGKMYIARPAPSGVGCDQILPIDWYSITRGGDTATNYQLLPRDRLVITENRLVRADNMISQITRPFERMLGFTLLGTQTVQVANRFPRGFSTGF